MRVWETWVFKTKSHSYGCLLRGLSVYTLSIFHLLFVPLDSNIRYILSGLISWCLIQYHQKAILGLSNIGKLRRKPDGGGAAFTPIFIIFIAHWVELSQCPSHRSRSRAGPPEAPIEARMKKPSKRFGSFWARTRRISSQPSCSPRDWPLGRHV